MSRLIIVDTNVLIAGIISAEQQSPVVKIVDAMVSGRVIYILSPELLKEYRDVLLRAKIRNLHRFSEDEIDTLLTEITLNAVWQEPPTGAIAPDQGDNHLWDLLKFNSEAILVTGDKLLLSHPPAGSSVVSPAVCLDMFKLDF